MEFQEYLILKKIDADAFKKADRPGSKNGSLCFKQCTLKVLRRIKNS
jgi:hypothetical protein